MLTPAKAIAVRKNIRTLNEKTDSSFLSVAAAEKQLDQLKKSIKKDLASMNEMSKMESLRLQMAMGQTEQNDGDT